MGARETALNALIACRKEGAWSNGVLKEYIQRDRLDTRDAALATRLCYGVLQNRIKLDFYLQQMLNGKVKDLHPAVRDILHMGIYQLYEMDKIPESAAVNESVALAKKYCKKVRSAPGLVNAVLRNAARSQDTIRQPRGWQEIYSHPQALIDLLMTYVGKQRMEPMLRANNDAPRTVIQVNTLKITAEELLNRLAEEHVEAQPHQWMRDYLVLGSTGNLEQLPSFREGLFYVQDAAARLVAVIAAPDKEAKVLDMCAAPGGKSFSMALSMENEGEIISCDLYESRTRLIKNGAERLHLDIVKAKVNDATVFADFGEFDCVLCDVPCSGLGIIRRKPDIKYKKTEDFSLLEEIHQTVDKREKCRKQWNEFCNPKAYRIYSIIHFPSGCTGLSIPVYSNQVTAFTDSSFAYQIHAN